MLAIRLQRVGKKKYSTYRLIVSEKTRDTHDKYTELLGTYNPHDKEKGFLPKVDRIKYWLQVGAVPSPTIHNLLVKNNIIEGKKEKSVFLTQKRKSKLEEKTKAKAEKEAAKAAAAAAPVEVKEEPPKEEVKTEEVAA